jgi:hypothetical protein
MQADRSSVYRTRRWYSPRSIGKSIAIRPRFYCSALVGISALLFLPESWSANVREAVWRLPSISRPA